VKPAIAVHLTGFLNELQLKYLNFAAFSSFFRGRLSGETAPFFQTGTQHFGVEQNGQKVDAVDLSKVE
jgi:hypothetical protein